MGAAEISNRIAYIDIMKGIAILCVIAGHYLSYPFISIIIWSFHMPLFVFLNGYFFKEGDTLERIKKAAKSYLKPYLIVLFVLLSLESLIAWTSYGNVGDVASKRLLSGVWALASNSALYKPETVIKVGAIWFLNALFWATVFMSLVSKLKNAFLQFVVIVAFLLLAVYLTSIACIPLGLNYAIAFLFWLMIGYRYSIAKKNNTSLILFLENRKGLFITLLIWIAILFLEWYTDSKYNICWLKFPLYGLELIGAFCGIMVCLHLSRFIESQSRQVSRLLQYLGASSLWILCVHAVDIEILPLLIKGSLSGITAYAFTFSRCLFDVLIALILRQLFRLYSIHYLNRNVK